jgi:6-phosphogluconolactonase
MLNLETFPSAEAAASAAAEAIAARLAPPGPRRMVVTGGRTPGPAYDRLARTDLDWPRIALTLSDERFVSPDSPQSNERLVRERLLQGHAAGARFVPLKGPGPTPQDDAARAESAIRDLLPFDVALLGMGEDGHFASLFPGAPDLAAALDPKGEHLAVGVAEAGVAPYVPRISLTVRPLFDAGLILLLVSGPAKRKLLERVQADPAFAPPVAALLRYAKAPVRILWSP